MMLTYPVTFFGGADTGNGLGCDYAWARINSSGNIADSVGIASVTRTATGTFQINFTNAWVSATSYGCAGLAQRSGSDEIKVSVKLGTTPSATSITLATSGSGVLVDPPIFYVIFFGESTVPSETKVNPIFGQWNSGGTLRAGSKGISSVVKNATGRYTITFTDAYSAATAYAAIAVGERPSTNNDGKYAIRQGASPTANSIQLQFNAGNGQAIDPGDSMFIAIGSGESTDELTPVYGQWNNSGTLQANSRGISSVVRNGTGIYTVTVTDNWASQYAWGSGAVGRRTSTNDDGKYSINRGSNPSTTGGQYAFTAGNGAALDPNPSLFIALGTSA